MSKMTVDGFDDIMELFKKEGAKAEKKIPKMLKAAAEVVVEAQKSEMISMGLVDTGAMVNSIKASAVKEDKEGVMYVTVEPTGKDKKGNKNSEKAFIAEYGKTGQPPKAWREASLIKNESNIHQAMLKVWEEDEE